MAERDSHPQQLLTDIREARQALEKGANRIYELTREYEGEANGDGEWQPGPKLRYMDAVLTAVLAFREQYERSVEKCPAKDLLEQMAARKVREQDPILWADYHRLQTEIEATKRWLSAKKEAVSALQSELSTERALAR